MLWTSIVVLGVMWLLGSYTMGSLIYILPIIAILGILINLSAGRQALQEASVVKVIVKFGFVMEIEGRYCKSWDY